MLWCMCKRKLWPCSLSKPWRLWVGNYSVLVLVVPFKPLHFEYKRRWFKNLMNSRSCLRECIKSIFPLIKIDSGYFLSCSLNMSIQMQRWQGYFLWINCQHLSERKTRDKEGSCCKGCASFLFAKEIFMAFLVGRKQHFKLWLHMHPEAFCELNQLKV
jgi:hypothetical protein